MVQWSDQHFYRFRSIALIDHLLIGFKKHKFRKTLIHILFLTEPVSGNHVGTFLLNTIFSSFVNYLHIQLFIMTCFGGFSEVGSELRN